MIRTDNDIDPDDDATYPAEHPDLKINIGPPIDPDDDASYLAAQEYRQPISIGPPIDPDDFITYPQTP